MKKLPLDGTARASIFTALAAYHNAGVDLTRLQTIEACPEKVSSDIIKSIRLGRSLPDAGNRAGLFNAVEKSLLAIGDASSRQDIIYDWLSDWYTSSMRLAATIQKQLLYPMVVLAVAFAAHPLPALFRGETTLVSYLALLMIQLGATIGSFAWLLKFVRHRQVQYFNEPWFRRVLASAQPKSFLRMVFERNYLKLLWLMLHAGMDAHHALLGLRELSRDRLWRKLHDQVIAATQSGNALNQTLSESGLLVRSDNVQILATAEQAGTISQSLGHHLVSLDQAVAHGIDERITWAGRAVYFGVMAFAVTWFF
jgi:type II secretory pathway component PulF